MTKKDVLKRIGGYKNWYRFEKFTYGLPVGVYPDGNLDYKEEDVVAFTSEILR